MYTSTIRGAFDDVMNFGEKHTELIQHFAGNWSKPIAVMMAGLIASETQLFVVAYELNCVGLGDRCLVLNLIRIYCNRANADTLNEPAA